MTTKTLIITVGQSEAALRDTLDAAKQATEGEEYESVYRLNFETLEGVSTVAKETTLKLLQAIRQHDPSSIRDLADIVGRDYREVHRNLSELEELDIVTFEREGRSKKPVVRYDELRFEIPLVDTPSDVDVSSPA
jgi:predicted transcriptional regulator